MEREKINLLTLKLVLAEIEQSTDILYGLLINKKKVIENRRLQLLSNKDWKNDYLIYVKKTQNVLDLINTTFKYVIDQKNYITMIKGRINAQTLTDDKIKNRWRGKEWID